MDDLEKRAKDLNAKLMSDAWTATERMGNEKEIEAVLRSVAIRCVEILVSCDTQAGAKLLVEEEFGITGETTNG